MTKSNEKKVERQKHICVSKSHMGVAAAPPEMAAQNHLHHHFHFVNNAQCSIMDSFMVTST